MIDGGTSLMVPRRAVADVLNGLIAAFELSGPERIARIRELVISSQIAESLAAAEPPAAALRERIPVVPPELGATLRPPSQLFVSREPLLRALADWVPEVQGEHDDYETPKGDVAYLFSPFSTEYVPILRSSSCHGGPIAEAAELHSY